MTNDEFGSNDSMTKPNGRVPLSFAFRLLCVFATSMGLAIFLPPEDEHSHQRYPRRRHAGCSVDDPGHPDATAEERGSWRGFRRRRD